MSLLLYDDNGDEEKKVKSEVCSSDEDWERIWKEQAEKSEVLGLLDDPEDKLRAKNRQLEEFKQLAHEREIELSELQREHRKLMEEFQDYSKTSKDNIYCLEDELKTSVKETEAAKKKLTAYLDNNWDELKYVVLLHSILAKRNPEFHSSSLEQRRDSVYRMVTRWLAQRSSVVKYLQASTKHRKFAERISKVLRVKKNVLEDLIEKYSK